jgi:hypothetical protein
VDRSSNAAVFPFQTTPAPRVYAAVVTLRRRSDAVGLAVGLIVFALSAAIAVRGLAIGEAGLLVAINSLADWLYYAIWPFMQFGVFVTIPHLDPLRLSKHRHNNLLDEIPQLSPKVLRSPPETTDNMGGYASAEFLGLAMRRRRGRRLLGLLGVPDGRPPSSHFVVVPIILVD